RGGVTMKSNITDRIVRHATIAKREAMKLSRKTFLLEYGDLLSAAYEALVDADARFDASRGIPFAPFATQRIQCTLLQSLRAEMRYRRKLIHHGREVNMVAGLTGHSFEQWHADEEVANEETLRGRQTFATRALDEATGEEREILWTRYVNGGDLKDLIGPN